MINYTLIKDLYMKIFERSHTHELGIYYIAAYIGYTEKKYEMVFFKELNEQIISCKSAMVEIFGEEIVNDIVNLKLNPKQ